MNSDTGLFSTAPADTETAGEWLAEGQKSPELVYGSAEAFLLESLASTGANETKIRGCLAAARSEGTHPSAAVTRGKGAAKARKSRTGAAVGSERGKNGLSR
ncbi:hypothetical protein SAMN04487914_13623 [Arthrobacter sp. ok909]|uniref:hypothetical protein n=1 Tax=Arthrobacter sp. ok909 TaxID=1761746 RepID=UPI00088705C4|nr:hypothetical protein SAMN04487914_13623 [Arthrobacter sp. ok909]